MCPNISSRTTRHATRICERIPEDLQAPCIATSRGRCFNGDREKVARLHVALDGYSKGISCNLDSSLLWARLEIGIWGKVELPGAVSVEIVQWRKSGVVNCDRGTSWNDLVEAVLVEVICGLDNAKWISPSKDNKEGYLRGFL